MARDVPDRLLGPCQHIDNAHACPVAEGARPPRDKAYLPICEAYTPMRLRADWNPLCYFLC